MRSALEQIILLICFICLFIQFSYFLVENLVSSYGQQFVFQLSLHDGVTSGKVQGSELCLDKLIRRDHQRPRQGRSFWGINACMRVARRVLSPGKGVQRSLADKSWQAMPSIAEMSSSGAKSFRAARQLLSTQSFISSPLSTRHIKERIAECAKTRVANNWKTKERSNIIFEKYRAFRSKPSC